MKLEEWKTYRTRFLVQAKQISSTLTFVDHLGRQHCGRKGDYLVESSDGVLSIAPRRIFEDIYVPMLTSDDPAAVENVAGDATPLPRSAAPLKFEPLQIEHLTPLRKPPVRQRTDRSFVATSEPATDVKHVATAAKPALSAAEGAVPPKRSEAQPASGLEQSAPTRGRKLPQPCRDRRTSAPNQGLM